MKNRNSVFAVGILLLGFASPSIAQDKIQYFVAQNGKHVFTNLVDNFVPGPVQETKASLAPEPVFSQIHELIDSISNHHGVDPALVKAVVKTESNFNRWAISSKGARGLMQLIQPTGVRFGVQDFFDPQQNIEGGVRYLKFLLEKFNGDLDLSLAAYNAGENLVERLGRIPSIPETRNYVRKVRSIYGYPPKQASAKVAPAGTAPAKSAAPKEEPPKIYRTVDERGVVHFSNVDPPK